MRAATALILTLALAFAPATSLAEEHAKDEKYDVTVSDERADIAIYHGIEDRDGQTDVVLDTEEGRMVTAFSFADEEDVSQRLALQLHQLVEYDDENENGFFDADDEVASSWRLSNSSRNVSDESNGTVEWRSLSTEEVTSDDGVEGTLVQGVAEFPSEDPIEGVLHELGQGENRTLALNVTVFGQDATVNGTEVPASQVYVQWSVENFPYVEEETQLALLAGSNDTDLELTHEEDRMKLSSASAVDGFGVETAAHISDEARVDGSDTDVELASLDASEDEEEDAEEQQYLSLSYERGSLIEHEMLFGSVVSTSADAVIGSDDDGDPLSSVPGAGLLGGLAALAAAAAIVQRRG